MRREVEALFLQLAPHANVLCGIFELAGQGGLEGSHSSREIARLVGVGVARLPDIVDALMAAQSSRTMEQVSGAWRFTLGAQECSELGLLLRGAALYQERVHQDGFYPDSADISLSPILGQRSVHAEAQALQPRVQA